MNNIFEMYIREKFNLFACLFGGQNQALLMALCSKINIGWPELPCGMPGIEPEYVSGWLHEKQMPYQICYFTGIKEKIFSMHFGAVIILSLKHKNTIVTIVCILRISRKPLLAFFSNSISYI